MSERTPQPNGPEENGRMRDLNTVIRELRVARLQLGSILETLEASNLDAPTLSHVAPAIDSATCEIDQLYADICRRLSKRCG